MQWYSAIVKPPNFIVHEWSLTLHAQPQTGAYCQSFEGHLQLKTSSKKSIFLFADDLKIIANPLEKQVVDLFKEASREHLAF